MPHPLFSSSQRLLPIFNLSIMNSVPLSLRKQKQPEKNSHSAYLHTYVPNCPWAYILFLLLWRSYEAHLSTLRLDSHPLSLPQGTTFIILTFLSLIYFSVYLESFPSAHKHDTVSLILTSHTSLLFSVKLTKSKSSLSIFAQFWAEFSPQHFRKLFLSISLVTPTWSIEWSNLSPPHSGPVSSNCKSSALPPPWNTFFNGCLGYPCLQSPCCSTGHSFSFSIAGFSSSSWPLNIGTFQYSAKEAPLYCHSLLWRADAISALHTIYSLDSTFKIQPESSHFLPFPLPPITPLQAVSVTHLGYNGLLTGLCDSTCQRETPLWMVWMGGHGSFGRSQPCKDLNREHARWRNKQCEDRQERA